MNVKRHNFKDLTGEKFSCLKVGRISENKTKTRGVLWECLCDCGSVVELPSNALTSGNTKTCGDITLHPRKFESFYEIPRSYVNAVKQNAIKRNLLYSVSPQYIWDVFLSQKRKCKLSGVDISFTDGKRITQGFSASLDRIDNSKGYVEGNVRWLHKDVNRMRWVCSDEEFLSWCEKCLSVSKNVSDRLNWERYALALAETASLRSEDPYKKVGACILRHDKSVAGVGYNGAPRGVTIDWSNRDERRKRVIHAEINALSYCRPMEGWLLASTLLPCSGCLQSIAAYGIKTVVYKEVYAQDDFALTLAKEFGIELIQLK